MSIVVFVGPTISQNDASRFLAAEYVPPVSQGDVLRVVGRSPTAIAVIDGYFEAVPSVWHKEILHALSRGIAVFGSASIGALRAAELWPFGMEGFGAIYEAFRDGRLEDDDEVAVTHGPEIFGYPLLSEAMVDVRRTLADAASQDVISPDTRTLLEGVAKSLHYKDRTYGAVMDMAGDGACCPLELAKFADWLPLGRVSQKRDDAICMLEAIRARMQSGISNAPPKFHFEQTTLWQRALAAEGL